MIYRNEYFPISDGLITLPTVVHIVNDTDIFLGVPGEFVINS